MEHSDETLKRLEGILQQALNPRHWSSWNNKEPEKVHAWVKSVRFAKNPHQPFPGFIMKQLLKHPQWSCPISDYWIWAPWRPLHDHVLFHQWEMDNWLLTTRRPKLVEEAFQELVGRDNPDVSLDIVEKVWMAVIRMMHDDKVSLHIFQETYRALLWRGRLAFPIWTEVFPHDLAWEPNWCEGCGLPILDPTTVLDTVCWVCEMKAEAAGHRVNIQKVIKSKNHEHD